MMTCKGAVRVLPILGAAAMAHAGEDGTRRVEVSADAQQRVVVEDEPVQVGGGAGGSTIFGAAPDWVNDLRLQVGGLQLADMNSDGLLDLVVGCYHSNSFPPYDDWHNYIYFNTGDELEASPSWQSTDEVSTGDIQVADFNNDGHFDVFAANGGFPMDDSVIYFGSADGPSESPGWVSNEPGNAWNNYALPVDIDIDGDVDLVTANQGNSPDDPYRPIHVFYNDDGVLETVPSWSTPVQEISNFLAAGDYNGDGWPDIAASKWAAFESGVYTNLSGTLENAPSWTTGDDSTDKGVAWGDFDGNGWIDLALGFDDNTRIYSNDAATLALTWDGEAPFYSHSDLRTVDVDSDGDTDLAEVHFSGGRTHIYLNEGGVIDPVPSWTYDASPVGTAIAFGDINGDGVLDLAIGYSGEPSVVVFYGTAPASCPGDGDGDGAIDVTDLLGLLAAWDTADAAWDLAPEGGDGVVNVSDLLALLAAWGPCE